MASPHSPAPVQRTAHKTNLLLRIALLALFVVAFGLQQRVILCNHGDGTHIEFLHAPGQCCDEPTFGQAQGPNDGDSPTHAVTCEHTSFAVDLAPTTASPTVVPPLAPNLAATFVAQTHPAAPLARSHRPPGRDPPRHDPGTSIRTTTRLLL